MVFMLDYAPGNLLIYMVLNQNCCVLTAWLKIAIHHQDVALKLCSIDQTENAQKTKRIIYTFRSWLNGFLCILPPIRNSTSIPKFSMGVLTSPFNSSVRWLSKIRYISKLLVLWKEKEKETENVCFCATKHGFSVVNLFFLLLINCKLTVCFNYLIIEQFLNFNVELRLDFLNPFSPAWLIPSWILPNCLGFGLPFWVGIQVSSVDHLLRW